MPERSAPWGSGLYLEAPLRLDAVVLYDLYDNLGDETGEGNSHRSIAVSFTWTSPSCGCDTSRRVLLNEQEYEGWFTSNREEARVLAGAAAVTIVSCSWALALDRRFDRKKRHVDSGVDDGIWICGAVIRLAGGPRTLVAHWRETSVFAASCTSSAAHARGAARE